MAWTVPYSEINNRFLWVISFIEHQLIIIFHHCWVMWLLSCEFWRQRCNQYWFHISFALWLQTRTMILFCCLKRSCWCNIVTYSGIWEEPIMIIPWSQAVIIGNFSGEGTGNLGFFHVAVTGIDIFTLLRQGVG